MNLQHQVWKLQAQVLDLQAQVWNLQDQVQDLQVQVQDLQDQVQNLQAQVRDLQNTGKVKNKHGNMEMIIFSPFTNIPLNFFMFSDNCKLIHLFRYCVTDNVRLSVKLVKIQTYLPHFNNFMTSN